MYIMVEVMKAMVKAKKIGGSIMVRIPKEITELEGIEENQIIEIDIKKTRSSGFGILKGRLRSFRKEDELNTHE